MQANVNTEISKKQTASGKTKEIIGSFPGDYGGNVSIDRGSALDYANMRASQLNSLLTLCYGGGGEAFRECAEHIQDNVLWLAASLAGELSALLPLVSADAKGGK